MAGQATCKLRRLAQQNPAIETLVLLDVPGTVDLIDTQAATRLVRQKRWNTVVPRGGSIASGGVMLFLGGLIALLNRAEKWVFMRGRSPVGAGFCFLHPMIFRPMPSAPFARFTARWGWIPASMTSKLTRPRQRTFTG